MTVTQESKAHDPLAHARELTEADNTLPKEAEAAYRGPNELSLATLRGIVLGTVGWFGGNFFGGLGSKNKYQLDGTPNPKHHSFKSRNIGAAMAFIGAIMGIYSGSKDARHFRRQVEELQDITIKQNQKVADLQDELREHVKAASGNGRPKLTSYDPSWEEEKDEAKEEADVSAEANGKRRPNTKISANNAQHHVQQTTEELAV